MGGATTAWALARRGIGTGDTVAVMAANTPEMYECHFGVPMLGAVLNTLNTRLDYYDRATLEGIVLRSCGLLKVEIDTGGAQEIARRARGTS